MAPTTSNPFCPTPCSGSAKARSSFYRYPPGQNDRRVRNERPGDGHALLLTAGEFTPAGGPNGQKTPHIDDSPTILEGRPPVAASLPGSHR